MRRTRRHALLSLKPLPEPRPRRRLEAIVGMGQVDTRRLELSSMSVVVRRLSWLLAVWLLVIAAPGVDAQQTEMEILDLYLEQFDTYRGAEGVWVNTVYDRCQRTGGTEQTAGLVPVASADATNDLLFQHARWHGERGRLIEPVFTWSDSDPYGIDFLEYHRDLVVTYEGWRAMNGYTVLPAWDPATPIPAEFAYDVGLPCKARESDAPGIVLPTFLTAGGGEAESPFWGYRALCDIPDANRLGKTIEGSWYHADVHLTIGGDMADAGTTLRDPIFWPWHKHVQGIYDAWSACPPLQEDAAGSQAAPAAALPLLGLVLVLVARNRRGQ